jgi:hypothetical protein
MTAIPSPEIRPAKDEVQPVIGPNLASHAPLCEAVTKFITTEYWWPSLQQQMKFWPVWKKIDDAWRARVSARDAYPSAVTGNSTDAKKPSGQDGFSAKAQSITLHKQCRAVTDLGELMSWEDGIPVRATEPPETHEGDFYQPTSQSVKAANSLLFKTAHEINLREEYRKSFGNFVKYGHGWVLTPFSKTFRDVEKVYRVDPQAPEAQLQVQAIQQANPGQQITPNQTPEGIIEFVIQERQIDQLSTGFRHVPHDAVFVDLMLDPNPQRQPCPIVKEHITGQELQANAYDADLNPFGYLNTELALQNDSGHYALSDQDEVLLREKLQHRYGLNDYVGGSEKGRDRRRARYTAFPYLRINEQTGELDTGDGTMCPTCKGKRTQTVATQTETGTEESEQPCPTCQGTGKVHPPLKRYVVVIFGGMQMQSTCLRIQEMNPKQPVPLLFAADAVEDDACAIPMSKAEIAMIPVEQVTLAETQFQTSKEQTINRGWLFKEDSPAAHCQNPNAPAARIIFENDPKEATRIDNNNFDETVTLAPYIERKDAQIQQVFGATDTLLGMISPGRRSALEIGTASEASRNPLVLMVDRYNRQMMGGWADQSIQNIELYGDRDYIRRITGREFFGNITFFTAVGQEFVKKVAAQDQTRYLLESSANDPAMQSVRPQLWNKLLGLMGIDDVVVPDGGLQLAKDQADKIVSQILGDGMLTPPMQDDPHDVYCEVFRAAVRHPMWQRFAPENIPLLMERLQMQEQLLIQKQMQELQQQIAQQQAMNPQPQGGGGGGNGNQPATPGKPANGPGEQFQRNQG